MHPLNHLSRPALILTLAFGSPMAGVVGVSAQDRGLEARVWLDRGAEPVLSPGEHARVYYRTSEDAHAAIFRIDTDGLVSLILPQHPGATDVVRGGRDYRLLFPRTPLWVVDDDPGVGYFFMVASPDPLDFSAFPFDDLAGWDLSGVGEVVYEDPYVAIDDYVAHIVPDWEAGAYALDFLTYNVGDTYSYPRFLCYDCHEAASYSSWNPYDLLCSTYRVVIWDDPYFYPSYRYSGTHLVVARRPTPLPRYGVAVRTLGAGPRPIVRSRAAPPRRVVEYKEPPGGPTPAQRIRRARPRADAPQERAAPSEPRPTLQPRAPRASGRLPVRAPPADAGARSGAARGDDGTTRGVSPSGRTTRGTAPGATRGATPGTRIVRPSRPSASGGTTRTRPGTVRSPRAPTRAAPSRPSAGRTPTRAVPGGSTRGSTRSQPRSRPNVQGRPAAPRTNARPQARPPGRSPSARPSPGARPGTRRGAPPPTVRARPTPGTRRGN